MGDTLQLCLGAAGRQTRAGQIESGPLVRNIVLAACCLNALGARRAAPCCACCACGPTGTPPNSWCPRTRPPSPPPMRCERAGAGLSCLPPCFHYSHISPLCICCLVSAVGRHNRAPSRGYAAVFTPLPTCHAQAAALCCHAPPRLPTSHPERSLAARPHYPTAPAPHPQTLTLTLANLPPPFLSARSCSWRRCSSTFKGTSMVLQPRRTSGPRWT